MSSEAMSDSREIEAAWIVPENEGTSYWRVGHVCSVGTNRSIDKIDLYEEPGPYSPIAMVRIWRSGEVFIRVPMMVCAIAYKRKEEPSDD